MRKAKTPRNYLSWSQLSLWEKNPELYRRVYFEGQEQQNANIDFGKAVALTFEQDISSSHAAVEIARILNSKKNFPKREFAIEADAGICRLKGVLDMFNPRKLAMREIKTGKKWTQEMVDKHGQIDFYDYLVWLKYRKPLKEISLFWIETKEDDFGDIVPTGKFKLFATKRSLEHRLKIHNRIRRAWLGIQMMSKEYANR